MEEFVLTASTKTPGVKLDASTGLLEISGRSIPEIATEFYNPMIDWVVEYGKDPKPETTVQVKFEYFNTSSSKSILDFFKKLEQIDASGKTRVNVKWFYETDDEAMEEAGMEYKMLLALPFEIQVG
jgi:hypothetical protein